MTEREQIIASASKRAFVDHNGRIMRVFNVLRSEYKALTTVWGAVEHEMEEDEFIESLDFLVLAGYMELRRILLRERRAVVSQTLHGQEKTMRLSFVITDQKDDLSKP